MKLVGNSIISFMLQGLCESFLVGRKAGLSHETMLEVVQASGYASGYYAFKGGAIGRREFGDVHFTVDLLHKDQTLMLNEAAAQRTPMPVLSAIREVTQAARAQGWGEEDIISVLKVLERQAGVEPDAR
jgi:3-hydroxyisobutyrate dehydrogenase